MPNPFASPEAYQDFVYALQERYAGILRSTLVYVSTGALFGRVEGMLVFASDVILCVQEYLNFELGIIEGYGYEVSRSQLASGSSALPTASEYCKASYPHKDKFYWYDPFPHPNDRTLVSTHPHHKHIPPDIKHHRIPAPEMSFTRPNLPFLIEEVERPVK
ncbi:MAG: hypothetical protein AUK03_02320 [Anaerolineae bacterium CG2_30_64_16]|nr:MAG: hypothetical protein AUK03_02320 [Anaerolineae bacterium CG2_30_64_16]